MQQTLKEKLKNTPVLGPILLQAYQFLRGEKSFSTSRDYWEERYRQGGTSGAGSYNELAAFKGAIVNQFVEGNQVQSVIEFGCGDGNQLKYFELAAYLGFDVSPAAITRCKAVHQSDHSKQFKLLSAYEGEQADLTMSLDVIFHLVEEDVYQAYMAQLFKAAKRYVVIYSSDIEDRQTSSASHFKHRKFTTWVKEQAPQFRLLQHIPNKYPYNGDGETTSVSDFYFYVRKA